MARRFAVLCAWLLAAFLLAACTPGETGQRKEFIAFLEQDVLAKPGVRVPRPSADKLNSFGPYAEHYAVLTRFHERMNESVARPMQEALAKGIPRSLDEVVGRRAEIEAIRTGLAGMRRGLDEAAEAALRERDALKQPDDLAKVYGAAFAKLVEAPAMAFRETFPTTDEAFGAALALSRLIEENRKGIRLNGSQMQIQDAKLRQRVQDALNAMNGKATAMATAQQRLRAAVYGN